MRSDDPRRKVPRRANILRRRHAGQRGYNLTELLTVMSILGITLLISIPALLQLIPQYRIKSEAAQLGSSVRLTRHKAIANRAPWRVSFDLDNERYTIQRTANRDADVTQAASWLPVNRSGVPVSDVEWISLGSDDLRHGLVGQFVDIDDDDLPEIVFDHRGAVLPAAVTGFPAEIVIAADSSVVRFNRYAIKATSSGQISIRSYKE
ncbi:MAG TPA: prepilin-type N-terminal cleavage/methylation domain-containing protein [Thermoanaerobaculia bacterium]|nr:prepilin-type N-terminal cleavage/methylation domain-containing protein [Thermoanaerobaculia bacterium]